MAKAYVYSGDVTIKFENKIVPTDCKYLACDPGSPVVKEVMSYEKIKDKPCVKFDYMFNSDASFMTVKDYNATVAAEKAVDGAETDYVVNVYKRFKNTDRIIPAYRTFNGKVLKAGDTVEFKTSNKDEIVFYEKVAEMYGDEVVATFTPAPTKI